jgi:phenylpropionate dioxygenase-like ring-hydroxylating dioxygenase large terminal subunit
MSTTVQRPAAHTDGPSYQEILDTDSRDVPAVLRAVGMHDIGPTQIPTEWYLSPEIHDLEVERVWKRTWQMACREEDVAVVGDTWVHDIAGISLVVVRSSEREIKAFYNSCLHRGRPLRDYAGRVNHLQCPYHGFTWDLGGALESVPCPWDFPDLNPKDLRLPEVRVACWGGFVFVNLDSGAEPLDQFLGDLVSHFDRWPLEKRFKAAHVAKVMPANWKLVQEAFMESLHVVTTHPELLPSLGDTNSQYDAFGNFSRAISAGGVQSPQLARTLTPQEIVNGATLKWDDEDPLVIVPDGANPRTVLADLTREVQRPALGDAVNQLSDAEMVDAIYYTLFPNLHPWGGYGSRITYRFRPYGDDHTRSIMECLFLGTFAGDRPPPAAVTWLDEDQSWLDAPELGTLAHVFQQDTFNIKRLQQGVRNNQRQHVMFSRYQELKIRHWYELYRSRMGL